MNLKTKTSINDCIISFLLLTTLLFIGCDPIDNGKRKVEAIGLNGYSVTNSGVQILIIDGCEYIWCKNGYGAGLTHKGNCQFCEERNKK